MLGSLPVLQFVLPLMSGVICFLISSRRLAWLLTLLVTAICVAMSLRLFFEVYDGRSIFYSVGGWSKPYGVELKIDMLSVLMLLLVNGIAFVTALSSYNMVVREVETNKIAMLYAMFMICISGMAGIIVSNDVFNIYVCLEISSISSYILVAMGRSRSALSASFEYLIVGTVGATFYLIGIGLLYVVTGFLNITDLSMVIMQLGNNRALEAGAFFIIIGLAIKIALFPLHNWLPRVYSTAPSFITSFFSGVSSKVALYIALRIIYVVFGEDFIFGSMHIDAMIAIMSILGIICAATIGAVLKDVKQILAFSSISHMGCLMLMVSVGGLNALIIHALGHALSKVGSFIVIGELCNRNNGKCTIHDLRGLGKSMPFTMIAFVILLSGLAGMPLTIGFISKWYIMTTLADTKHWWYLMSFALGSVISLVYTWRLVENIYVHHNKSSIKCSFSKYSLVGIWGMTALVVVFGMYPVPLVKLTDRVATRLSSDRIEMHKSVIASKVSVNSHTN